MKLILTDEYYIDCDPLNYELVSRKRNKNFGKEGKTVKNEYSIRTVGYFRTLNDAIERFVSCVTKDKTSSYEGDLKGYCELITKVMNETVDKVYEKAVAVSNAD